LHYHLPNLIILAIEYWIRISIVMLYIAFHYFTAEYCILIRLIRKFRPLNIGSEYKV
jgi:hypothetical protein